MSIVYPSVKKMIRSAERRQLALGIPVDGIIDGEIVQPGLTENEINDLTAEVKVCVCSAAIEEVDSGNNYRYWAHVKRMRIYYDHAAIPKLPSRGSGDERDLKPITTSEVDGYPLGGRRH